jgi:signal transduction histidine kinase
VTAPLIAIASVRRDGLDALDATVVLTVVVAWSFLASGFVASERRPRDLTGPLLTILGLWWTAGHLMDPPVTSSALVGTIGEVATLGWVSGFVAVLLAFPTAGRLVRRVDRVLVAIVLVAAVPMQVAWLLFRDEQPNAFLVWPSATTAEAIDTAQRVIWLGAAVVLVGLLAARWTRASPPLRRTLAPVVAGGVTVLVFSVYVVVQKLTTPPALLVPVLLAAYAAVPVALLASVVRARLARTSAADLCVELRTELPPAHLRDALARALGDPSATLAYWLPEYHTYADLHGRPVALPRDGPERATTLIDVRGGRVAALLHDPSLRDQPELLEAVTAAAAIALENARLHAELRARLEELRGSRARLLDATQAERRRLERDLHDGAQQRLVALSLELGMLGERLDADSETSRALARARHELTESLQELRELARGIHPVGNGLEVALESLVARANMPVRLTVELAERLPERVEVAAYYLVAEGLTNIARYAHASRASVDVRRFGGLLLVEMIDDGVGGADTEDGSGLRGLADRLEALGGRLRVWSPQDAGTRIRGEIPCG